MRHRPFILGVLTACCCMMLVLGGVVAYAVSATPEINNANATIKLSGAWQQRNCVGEDLKNYRTYVAANWTGTEAQNVNDVTDHGLSGGVKLSGIQWTINNATLRGVLIGAITLTTASGAGVYSGKLTLVTQGLPLSTTENVYARGWIQAQLTQADETVTPGDDFLIANVEFRIGLFSMHGRFGNLQGSLNTPNFSVVTNVAPTPADGIC